MNYSLITANVLEWAQSYKGEKFHSLLCDPPYHLGSIVKRYGSKTAKPPKNKKYGHYGRHSSGFMGQTWDSGDIAFDPETWAVLGELLHPGAFCMAYAGSRGWHRVAVAIEDAGFVMHPTVFCWTTAQGFPKATRIDNQADRLGEEAMITAWAGHRYGLQALKPAVEPILIFQKPYSGRPIKDIIATGAGALNIDAARVAGDAWTFGTQTDIRGDAYNTNSPSSGNVYAKNVQSDINGRWPANFMFVHDPRCVFRGYSNSAKHHYIINRFDDGAKPFGGGAGHEFTSEKIAVEVEEWDCHEDCPAFKLNRQAGGEPAAYFNAANWLFETVDPFIYVPKASKDETEAGLDDFPVINTGALEGNIDGALNKRSGPAEHRNPHPTVKPIALNKILASLLLPPVEYTPRRLFVPFAGVGSEVIGGMRAGWDEIVGVELMDNYAEVGQARIDYWRKQPQQMAWF